MHTIWNKLSIKFDISHIQILYIKYCINLLTLISGGTSYMHFIRVRAFTYKQSLAVFEKIAKVSAETYKFIDYISL